MKQWNFWIHNFSYLSPTCSFSSSVNALASTWASQKYLKVRHIHYSLLLTYFIPNHLHTKSFWFCLQNTS